MAAAISFFALLSLIPLFLLAASTTGFFLGSSKGTFGQVVTAVKRFFPRATAGDIERLLLPLVEKKAIAGSLGLLFLGWVAFGLFEAVERAINAIWGQVKTRSFLHRQLGAFLIMLGSGTLLLLAFGISWLALLLQAIDLALADRLPFRITPLWDLLLLFVPMLLTIGMFTFIYLVASARSMPFKEALIGGLAAGVLWQIAKLAFNWYILHFADWYASIYGLLGGLVALLLWIFYTSLLLLLGAEIIKVRLLVKTRQLEEVRL
jgi:membrane protein